MDLMGGSTEKGQHAAGVIVIDRLAKYVPIEVDCGVCTDHDGRKITDHIYGASFLKRKAFHI
jgi:DNA polymerase III alpha subunit